MNLGSWIVLAIVVAILALAIRATFFKKSSHGCCGGAGKHDGRPAAESEELGLDVKLSCGDCSACQGCATRDNCLQPTIKPL